MIDLAAHISKKNTPMCREIDLTFFNSAVKYDEVYIYLENALESFAFM